MPSPNAQRDGNFIPSALGTDDVTNIVRPMELDTATGDLLIEIMPVSSTVPVVDTIQIDGNRVPTAFGVDDTDGSVRPLLIDNRNGGLYMDIVIV